jgi:hypothetical protein
VLEAGSRAACSTRWLYAAWSRALADSSAPCARCAEVGHSPTLAREHQAPHVEAPWCPVERVEREIGVVHDTATRTSGRREPPPSNESGRHPLLRIQFHVHAVAKTLTTKIAYGTVRAIPA